MSINCKFFDIDLLRKLVTEEIVNYFYEFENDPEAMIRQYSHLFKKIHTYDALHLITKTTKSFPGIEEDILARYDKIKNTNFYYLRFKKEYVYIKEITN